MYSTVTCHCRRNRYNGQAVANPPGVTCESLRSVRVGESLLATCSLTCPLAPAPVAPRRGLVRFRTRTLSVAALPLASRASATTRRASLRAHGPRRLRPLRPISEGLRRLRLPADRSAPETASPTHLPATHSCNGGSDPASRSGTGEVGLADLVCGGCTGILLLPVLRVLWQIRCTYGARGFCRSETGTEGLTPRP